MAALVEMKVTPFKAGGVMGEVYGSVNPATAKNIPVRRERLGAPESGSTKRQRNRWTERVNKLKREYY